MRYQFSSPGFRQYRQNPYLQIPEGVKLLLIINIITFLIVEISGLQFEIYLKLGLVPTALWTKFVFWQPITYLFLHGNFIHILFNMFVLWMFGKDLEINWGKKSFLTYYFISGIGAGFITAIINWNSSTPVVGASGAIYGLLLAYGLMYPNRIVYLYGLFPLKVKFMVVGLAVIAFFASLTPQHSTISHITHLSGMLVGYLFLRSGNMRDQIKRWYYKQRIQNIHQKLDHHHQEENELRQEVDRILEKMNDEGWGALSNEEIITLKEASENLYNRRPPN